MKTTEKQNKIIDSVLSIIRTWQNTNDITSSTHYTDIREFLYADLMDDIDSDDISELDNIIAMLLDFIKENSN